MIIFFIKLIKNLYNYIVMCISYFRNTQFIQFTKNVMDMIAVIKKHIIQLMK